MRLDAQGRLQRYEEAFADYDAPFAFVDLDAMWGNADQLLARAGDKPIRVASKSLRCRPLQREILDASERFDGLLTFTLTRRCGLPAKVSRTCCWPTRRPTGRHCVRLAS
ncbi:Alanine racemase [Mycobacterium tuberculosis]|nr:Alanine racemase [Mycobacterium tuberculosis]